MLNLSLFGTCPWCAQQALQRHFLQLFFRMHVLQENISLQFAECVHHSTFRELELTLGTVSPAQHSHFFICLPEKFCLGSRLIDPFFVSRSDPLDHPLSQSFLLLGRCRFDFRHTHALLGVSVLTLRLQFAHCSTLVSSGLTHH